MKLYFSTKSIPKLQHLPLTKRLEVIQAAQKKLIGPEKLLLNILKLIVVIPIFVLILQTSTNWVSIIWALLLTLLYPLFIKPFQYGLCAKYIPSHKFQGE
ncbi:DUF6170 family protein [Paraglaciecola sp.]|uniref:DUF6170 family protein n=1 Tax=Paraglaciecola sp. TaxID=1920173 RepID=UPI0032656A6D